VPVAIDGVSGGGDDDDNDHSGSERAPPVRALGNLGVGFYAGIVT